MLRGFFKVDEASVLLEILKGEIFHKNALLTPNVHNFDDLGMFVAKICRCDYQGTFSAKCFRLKSRICKVFCFLDV